MAWPNPFRRQDQFTRTCWGYTFQLTKDHWTEEGSHSLKFSYDKLGEQCLNILNEIESCVKSENITDKIHPATPKSTTSSSKPKRDLYKSLETYAKDHPTLQQLWTEVNTIPVWVDWDQVHRAKTGYVGSTDRL